ncbi:MAG TPA: ABC transporter ATP-binding protein [Chloroflexota bacterium]
MASVTLRGVTKRFGQVIAVSDLSLEVRDREFLVLLGPSGCGKTTALRLIAGLESPSAGEIRIGDRVVNSVSPKDRDIAMVFQNYALYPHMTVFDNMAFGLKMRKEPGRDIQRRVHEAADMLDIGRLLPRKPGQLSGGERQRVALARAIVREPQVFLMDEPLSNLDAQLRVHTRSELVKLQRRLQTTVIYVTHDQTEAMTMADRVVVLQGGLLQQVDEPQTLYDEPANRFVAGFIGSPGMNFFPGHIGATDAGLFVKTGTIQLPLGGTPNRTVAPGQSVLVGVRPEDLLPAAELSRVGGQAAFQGSVDTIEPLGSEKLLHLIGGGTEFVARVDPRFPAAIGDQLSLAFDPKRAHLFDAQSGVRLQQLTKAVPA